MKRVILILSMVLVTIALLTACGGTNTTPPTPSPLPPTATSNPPTATMPPPTSTSPPTPSSTPTPDETGLEEQKFSFVAPLATQEEDERIRHGLTEISGIKKATVNEISVQVVYDPNVITVEEIRKAIEVLGYQVNP